MLLSPPAMKVTQTAAVACALAIQCAAAATSDTVGRISGAVLLNVTTNQGLITEHYKTQDGSAVIQYEQGTTTDWPVVFSTVTNASRVYDCSLMASQLENAPKWNPEETAPPLSPKEAAAIALRQAFFDLGTWWRASLDFEPSRHWLVVEVSLVRNWRWPDHGWYYKVGVKRIITGSSPGIADAQIFVTMDGKAAPYIERKRSAEQGQPEILGR